MHTVHTNAPVHPAASEGYCPQCFNAGGPATVSAGGTLVWPNGNHGICGDPAAGPQTMAIGGSAYTGASGGAYVEGSVMTAVTEITAFHMGR